MALTLANLTFNTSGSKRTVIGTIAFDASYPTGGESLTAANLGLGTIDQLRVFPKNGYVFEYDYTNSKLLAYSQGITTGATGAADSTSGALVLDDTAAEGVVRAMGTSASTTYKLGGLKEVASTADLSAVTGVRFEAVGV